DRGRRRTATLLGRGRRPHRSLRAAHLQRTCDRGNHPRRTGGHGMRAPVGLLPIPVPPHDPRSLLLAGWVGPEPRRGFRIREAVDVEVSPASGALSLGPTPQAQRLMTEPAGSFGGLRPPPNVGLVPRGGGFRLGPVSGRLLRSDPCCCRFDPLPCFTRVAAAPPPLCGPDPRRGAVGPGAAAPAMPPDPTQLADPHGLAICAGDVA